MSEINVERFTVEDNPVEIPPGEIKDDESLTKSARLFYVGRHKGKDYSAKDLAMILENFDPDKTVPVQLDHSASARDTVGFVRRLWTECDGLELHGEMDFLGRENIERVRLGLWKRVSVSLEIRHPEMKLLEVSITPFPALSRAEMFSLNDEEGEEVGQSGSDSGPVEMDTGSTGKEEFTRLRQEFDKLEIQHRDLEKKLKENQAARIVERYIQKGKTTPAMGVEEVKLLLSLDKDQKERYFRCKDAQPPLFYLGTMGAIQAERPGEAESKKAGLEAEEILRFTSWRKD